jgi:glycosyltransferase involved in cell wall biosynthesis
MKLYYITRVSIPSLAAQSVQIASMCEAFCKESIEFKLISPLTYENKDLKKIFKWDKVNIKFKKFKYLEFTIKSFFKVLKEKPTHIFTRDIVIAFILSFVNIKVIYEVHKEPRTKIADFFIKYLKNKSNFKLVSISKTLKEFYIKSYQYKDNQILDYHDGVCVEKYDKYRQISKKVIREELDLPKYKTIVMHTGSLYDGRGAELFEIIIKNFPEIYFVQVGGSKEYIDKWRNYYKNYSNIKIIEHQDNGILVKYQMSADLLFYPLTKKVSTWWCCSPMKIFEYMATGIPILASNIGSVEEVLTEKNAIIFNPENKQSIIDGVKWFLENREKAKQLAQNALQEVREKYTWEKRVKNILEFIK